MTAGWMREKTPAEASRESGNIGAAVSSRAGDQIRDVLPPERTVAGLEEPFVAHLNVRGVDGCNARWKQGPPEYLPFFPP
jgi:hypothetical protein